MSRAGATERPPIPPARGLAGLAEVTLSRDRQELLDGAVGSAGGIRPWRARKRAEARDLLALAQIAPPGRMEIHLLDLQEALRALFRMEVPVPCRPEPDGPLVVEAEALLGITYPQEALSQPVPGFAMVEILMPRRVWHANVSVDRGQRLCLGATLPAGIHLKETVLMVYGALSMQTVMIDPSDPAGVLNHEAALWWSDNLGRIPLTRVPFLGRKEAEPGGEES